MYIVSDTSKIALIIGVDTYYYNRLDGNYALPQLFSCKKDAIDLYNLAQPQQPQPNGNSFQMDNMTFSHNLC
jgi:hypothetical protein